MPDPASVARIELGSWATLGEAARSVRLDVFVREQGIPAELELDARDATATHAVAFDGQGRPIATGRLLPDAHIGRMAVLQAARGAGVGACILQALVDAAHARGVAQLHLHAQASAVGFYARQGFTAQGEEYLEADIPHRTMVRDLPPPPSR